MAMFKVTRHESPFEETGFLIIVETRIYSLGKAIVSFLSNDGVSERNK
jgi:hypothetical protein